MSYQKTYTSDSVEPYKISRSKIDLFIQCPRCFYLDQKLNIKRPKGFPFNLNSAVDHLLKKEFDIHRLKGEPHPLMKEYGIDAIPYSHAKLDDWRHNFTGVQYLDLKNNFLLYGAVDDIWINPKDELIVVDYKATSKDSEVNLDADWQDGYKRQMEIYQWLLRKNGFKVSRTGYFVYCNGQTDRKAFDAKLEFDITLIDYKGDDSWVEKTITEAYKCLNGNKIPNADPNCDYCNYVHAINSK
jgi:hypothetical protein